MSKIFCIHELYIGLIAAQGEVTIENGRASWPYKNIDLGIFTKVSENSFKRVTSGNIYKLASAKTPNRHVINKRKIFKLIQMCPQLLDGPKFLPKPKIKILEKQFIADYLEPQKTTDEIIK